RRHQPYDRRRRAACDAACPRGLRPRGPCRQRLRSTRRLPSDHRQHTRRRRPTAMITPDTPFEPFHDVLIDPPTLKARITELGAEITRDYAGGNPLLIGVLKGSVFFMADLARAIDLPLEMD